MGDWEDLALPWPKATAARVANTNRRALDGDNVGLWLDKLVFRNRQQWSLEREDRTFALEQQFCRQWHLPAGEHALQERAGSVVFYDGLPVDGRFKLALDVLTPHHKSYYEREEPPADWESPVPHTFLTVVETTFELWLGVRTAAAGDLEALAWARDALVRALEERGVGAKTAAGYGRLKVVKEMKG